MRLELFFLLLVLAGCNYPKGNIGSEMNSKLPTIYLYGLPDDLNIKNAAVRIYGFKFVQALGCVVNQKQIDSLDLLNEKLNSELIRKYGSDFENQLKVRVNKVRDGFESSKTLLGMNNDYTEFVKGDKRYLNFNIELDSVSDDLENFYINAYSYTDEQRPRILNSKLFKVNIKDSSIKID